MLSRFPGYSNAKEVAITVVGSIEEAKHGYYSYFRNQYYKRKIEQTAEAVGPDLWVGGRSIVNSSTVIGDNAYFGGLHIHGEGRVTIGDNLHSGSGCEIRTQNHNYEGDALPYDESSTRKPVSIGDNVWVGMNVLVIPGVSIGEGAIVQSGSVVTHDIPKGAIAGGHPAEVFEHRDMEHYERLKAEEKFN